MKLFVDALLHSPYTLFLTRECDVYRRSLLVWAPCALAAMGVGLYVVVHCVVDDECEVVKVKALGRGVGRHEELCEMVL